MPSETGPGPWRKLGAALLNATLMLVALILLLGVLLVWQLRGLTQDLRLGLRAEIATLAPQIDAARTSAAEAMARLQDPEAQRDLTALIDRLDRLETQPQPQSDSALRALALAIIATAASQILGPDESL
ncbi:hypothetical protein JI664_00035 [Rhodobacter sp. NTK016B]|uniref:hypothetical protein n=1 Tax=Rhodobacter sp. NTK016B TaxID=2759676 RepID=UPI001A8DF033|nr:hypothetical protein [Rhodobacter sp. NTK016B]MBN8290344.1 hypothetical protein [Rhodobacter sp. NTK016B]